jgi:TATA-box binding protein (TBP) (component of TFIID and TFIIIB)
MPKLLLKKNEKKNSIDDDWKNFCDDDNINEEDVMNEKNEEDVINEEDDEDKNIENEKKEKKKIKDKKNKCTDLYISTQTKIAYLNMPIVLKDVFWKIPIFPYHLPQEGVVKKQMKFNSTMEEEVTDILEKAKEYSYVTHHIISQIIKPDGRIKFKDVRKVSIGLCKKDIMSSRCKKKSAFYNCFVVILRLLHNGIYKEINVKVFNTGKLEIPGIQNKEILEKVLNILVRMLCPIVAVATPDFKINFIDHKSETVLINSNFSCGYYINREKMYELLKYKYKINSAYDPCSYPGIQCEFYYNNKTSELVHQTGIQKSAGAAGAGASANVVGSAGASAAGASAGADEYTKVSFMIFRTGSVLIVGKCTEYILRKIYDFICKILVDEYDLVKEQNHIISAKEENLKINKSNKKGRKYIQKF